jgi:hypothetical protein
VNKLDLRKDGKLSVENAKIITAIQQGVQQEYTDFIGNLIKANKVEDLQWLMQVTCRNTYISKIYDLMCRLSLLECLLKDGKNISCIYIDSPAIEYPVIELLERYNSKTKIYIIECKGNKKFSLIKNIVRNLYYCLNLWLWPLLIKNKSKPKTSVFLLDTFLLKGSFDENLKLQDRHYPGLIDMIPDTLKDKTWYLSTLSGFKYPWDWIQVFSQVSKSVDSIILKEYWLKPKDYLFAIQKSITLAKTIDKIPSWNGLNISRIVKEEIMYEKGGHAITQSILMYLSFNRYKESGIKIDGMVDWFENQTVDRGLYLGMRKYFPDTYIKGYLGFVPEEYYVGIFPAKYENEAHMLPDELLVVGNNYANDMKRFFSQMKVFNAPAFRFKDVLSIKQKRNNRRDVILLALPMKFDEIARIIGTVVDLNFDNSAYRWIIKPHPTSSEKDIQKLIPNSLSSVFEFSNLPLTEIFQNTHLLITSASSAALEAAVSGIYVAIIGNRSGPTINRLSGLVDESFWSICYTAEDLEYLLIRRLTVGEIDVSKYFNPITLEGSIKMMTFKT